MRRFNALPTSPKSQFCNGKNNKVIVILVNIQQNTCQYQYSNGAKAKSLFWKKDGFYYHIKWLSRFVYFCEV